MMEDHDEIGGIHCGKVCYSVRKLLRHSLSKMLKIWLRSIQNNNFANCFVWALKAVSYFQEYINYKCLKECAQENIWT